MYFRIILIKAKPNPLQHSDVIQLDQFLCTGIVHKASLCSIWEHMEEPLDNGALVMLASTKRPRQAKLGVATTMLGHTHTHTLCFYVCCGFEVVCTCDMPTGVYKIILYALLTEFEGIVHLLS